MKFEIFNGWKYKVGKHDAEIIFLELEWDSSGYCGRYKYVKLTILNFCFMIRWD